jgi:hypothetical protein
VVFRTEVRTSPDARPPLVPDHRAMPAPTLTSRRRSPTRERPPLPSWELYQVWHAAFDEAEDALAAWNAAPVVLRADAFAVYRAAADREDAAAARWIAA